MKKLLFLVTTILCYCILSFPLGATTRPLSNIAIGDHVSLGGEQFIKLNNTGLLMMSSTLTCPHGKRIAGQWAKCFECPSNATYDSTHVTCSCNDSSLVYDIDTSSCRACAIGYVANSEGDSCVIDTTNYSVTLDTYYDAINCTDPVAWMDEWAGCSDLGTVIANESVTDEQLAAKTVCLLDPRDYRAYRVRRFDDDDTIGQSSGDKCWMIDSLRFGGDYGEIDGCSANSGAGNFSGGGAASSSMAQETFSTTYRGHCRQNTIDYNYLYDWVAAMQSGLAYYGSPKSNFNGIQQGICPSGWHLPTGGSGSEYYALTSRYGTDAESLTNFWVASSKWNGKLSGRAWKSWGTLEYQGRVGYYWSSSALGGNDAKYLYFSSGSSVSATYNDNRNYGFAVRCLKD
ncbi:hypothetical protein IJJ27_00960 [bacterium]|nr:hypothetical protein [bacterium]